MHIFVQQNSPAGLQVASQKLFSRSHDKLYHELFLFYLHMPICPNLFNPF